jgi:DNA polymerase III epsilon subunit-like protein
MSNLHVMLDLETMGVGHDAAIISIGAVKFDPKDTHIVAERFYVPVDLHSCMKLGLKVSGSTIMWWMHKDRDKARIELLAAEPVDLPSALEGFTTWYGPDSMPVWSNGANFDIPIMRNALRVCGMTCPWSYLDDRCFRTLKNLIRVPRKKKEGVAHHALDDAIAQAHIVQEISARLKLEL